MIELKTIELLDKQLFIKNTKQNLKPIKKIDAIIDTNKLLDIIEPRSRYISYTYNYLVFMLIIISLIFLIVHFNIYFDVYNDNIYLVIGLSILYLCILAVIITYIVESDEKIIYCCDKYYIVKTNGLFYLYVYNTSLIELRNFINISYIYIYVS